MYVVASVVLGLLREGFDLSRHAWSQLALGDGGWIQVTKTGRHRRDSGAAAVGLRRALRTGPGATGAAMLLAMFGVSMVVAGIFPVGAVNGFPAGLPQATTISATAAVHLLAGALGFPCLAAALLVLARQLSREGVGRLATACRVVAPLFLAGFPTMASELLGAAGVPVFVAVVVAVFALLSVVFVHRYRAMPNTDGR